MGVVYKARDLRLERIVALKFLPAEWCRDPAARERFVREAKAASALDHSHICTIHEIDETDDGQLYIAMAFCEGESLDKKIERGPLPVDEAIRLTIQIADGLQRAHEAGIIHRDIKPANIMVTDRGDAKIVDFGLAKLVPPPIDESSATESPTASALTVGGTVLGTAAYMSPEQARGEQVDARSDIFAVGLVLYEMLSATRPFARKCAVETAAAILKDDPPPLSNGVSGIPRVLETIVSRCLEKRADRRFASARELITALQAVSLGPGAPRAAKTESETIRSIAVLPFSVEGGGADVEYLADGLTEGITAKVCGLPGIDRVIARHSVSRYKGKSIEPETVGRQLGVDSVLVGDLALWGDELVISVELVATQQGNRLWGNRYARRLSEFVGIEDEISKAVAGCLRIELSEADRARIEKRHTEDSAAYHRYLRGRHLWNRRTEEALNRSIELYHEATAIDPNFALAYTGIADSWVSLAWNDVTPKRDAFKKALSAVMAALDIDDHIPESHVSLGMVLWYLGGDWARSEREFQRAVELNPSCAEAYHQYAHLLAFAGRADQAVEIMRRAIDLEPVSRIINSCCGQVLYFARRYDEAIAYLEAAIEIEPGTPGPHSWLGMIQIQRGEYSRAEEALKTALEGGSFVTRVTGALGYAYGIRGDRERALEQLERLSELAAGTFVDACFEAWIHAAIGDDDGALAALDRAFGQDANWLAALKVDPFFDAIRPNPRFQDLLRRLNIPAD